MSRIEAIIKQHTGACNGTIDIYAAMEQFGEELLEAAAENAKTTKTVSEDRILKSSTTLQTFTTGTIHGVAKYSVNKQSITDTLNEFL